MLERNQEGAYRYAYQGQEKDVETGMEAFELRLWDARIGRWLTTDPYGQFNSPYLGMGNNPISHVDADGGKDNPIYGSDGTFKGVDEFGLNGAAIVYDGEFTNGMSQSEILNNGGFFIGDNFDFMNGYAGNKIMNHYMTIPNRPDFDGMLTLSEANIHFRRGSGTSLYVDAAQINLSPVNVESFPGINQSIYYNFFTDAEPVNYANHQTNTGLIYGTIRLTLLDKHGTVRLGGNNGYLDRYDFDIKPWNSPKRILRNIGTLGGRTLAGKGKGFNVYNYGTGTVPMVLTLPFNLH